MRVLKGLIEIFHIYSSKLETHNMHANNCSFIPGEVI